MSDAGQVTLLLQTSTDMEKSIWKQKRFFTNEEVTTGSSWEIYV